MAEGGGLLNRYTLQRRIEGSNPSVSASARSSRLPAVQALDHGARASVLGIKSQILRRIIDARMASCEPLKPPDEPARLTRASIRIVRKSQAVINNSLLGAESGATFLHPAAEIGP